MREIDDAVRVVESPPIAGLAIRFANTPVFAKTRAPINCWIARILPTLPFVLERLGFVGIKCNAVSNASGTDRPQNTFWPKFDKLCRSKAIRLHVVEKDT